MGYIPLRFRDANKPEPAGEPEQSYEHVNLLALLFRQMKADLFLSSRKMAALMPHYLKDPRCQIKQTSKARSSEQSNLKRGLAHPGMTVKNFTKSLRVIRPKKIVFSITLEMRDGTKPEYFVNYDQDKLFSFFHNREAPNNHNFLRELWDMIYESFGFTEASWKKAVTEYLDNPINGYDDRRNIKSSERSNLRRGLLCSNMTIENFTKALRIIDPAKIMFTMELQLDSDAWTQHTVTMEGSSLALSPFDEEDSNGNA